MVKTNQKLMKIRKESKTSAIERTRNDETKLEEHNSPRSSINKFNYGIKRPTNTIKKAVKQITDECSIPTGEPEKSKPGKLKSFFCICTKKNKEGWSHLCTDYHLCTISHLCTDLYIDDD